jgi:Glycosyl transferase family 2
MVAALEAHAQPSKAYPLVSIGIPTYNRIAGLTRALETAVQQTYPNLEIVISDNASTDGTRDACVRLQRSDPRVRYVRQQKNLGPESNFARALSESRGDFFMWLADDDWLDLNYVSECAQFLIGHPDYVLAGGVPCYYAPEPAESTYETGILVELSQDSPSDRILSYYQKVLDNGVFYGLARRAFIAPLSTQARIGEDWLMVAELAAVGKIGTLSSTRLHRSKGGLSRNAESLVKHYGLTGWKAKHPFALLAFRASSAILWRSEIHKRQMPFSVRSRLSLRVYANIIGRYTDLSVTGSIANRIWAMVHLVAFGALREWKSYKSETEATRR